MCPSMKSMRLKKLLRTIFLIWVMCGTADTRRSRFRSELRLMHCMCEITVPFRLQRIQCMEQFIPSGHTYTMGQSIQYCGYFAMKTHFGQTVRQRIYITSYNPWQITPDLNTNIICSYTRISPGNAAPSDIWYVTSRGWVVAKCILNMAFLNVSQSEVMLRTCCS